MLANYKTILWDFDGVIMDSMPVRTNGFSAILKSYPQQQVQQLLDFHNSNGGLSRYVKFRYFFETIRQEPITDEQLTQLTNSFSELMLNSLINEELLIRDCIEFIKSNHSNYKMHIVSGSDGKELNYICQQLDIAKYFISIEGSPTPKNELVKNLLAQYGYDKDEVVLIGDSKNDYEASKVNGISFLGYNNILLKDLNVNYIESLQVLAN